MKMQQLVMLLKKYHLTLASCESLTAGLFANKITKIAGSSTVFKGGLVTYNNEIKHKLAQVPLQILNQYGAVSEQTAYYMAYNTQQIFATDIAISFTGNAGPSAQENKPIGLCFIAVCYKNKTEVETYHFQAQNRDEVRKSCINQGIENILKKIKENN